MKEKRIQALNFYKAVGALLVVLIHVTATPVTTLPQGLSFWIVFLMNRLAKPAVPMFIFASGLALYYSYRDKPFQYGSFLVHRVTKILIPYLVWSALYYGYFVQQGVYTFSWKFFLVQTAGGRLMYHFYFVVAILQFYLLFGFFRKLVQSTKAQVLLPVAVMLNVASYALVPGIWIHRGFLSSLVYFLAGCYFAKDYERAMAWLKKWSRVLFLTFFVTGIAYCGMFYLEIWQNDVYMDHRWMLNYIYFPYCVTGLLLYYQGLDWWCGKGTVWVSRVMDALNKSSYYIYLSHPFALILAGQFGGEAGITGVLRIMALQLVCVVAGVIPLCVGYTTIKKHMFLKSR